MQWLKLFNLMGRLALIAAVGPNDAGVTVDPTHYIKPATLKLFNRHDSSEVSLHAFTTALRRLKLEPSEAAMDLLVIACTMYAADTRIKRETFGEDCWTRVIDLFIPVHDTSLWLPQKALLEDIFKFLTGDIWTVHFRARAVDTPPLSPRGKLSRYKMPYQTDTVCLFSGGMDSFIGAINLLESGVRPLLIGHSKSADVSMYQERAAQALKDAYPSLAPSRIDAFIKVPKANLFNSEDHTERGRSFMFLSLGAICASSLSPASRLVMPENGMISLNIPLTPLRVGSHSTRTTHPYYISKMQALFTAIGLGTQIINPFQFKTKGEMLKECPNAELVKNTETMSCSHPSGRYEGLGNGHCGSCVPCIIRRASFAAAKVADIFPYRRDIYRDGGLQIDKAEGADILAFKYMIAKVQKHPDYLTAAIRNTGPLGDNVSEYIAVYKRALQEVDDVIKTVQLV